MNAIELLAKQLYKFSHPSLSEPKQTYVQQAESLLSLCYPCPECKDGVVPCNYEKSIGYEVCPVCHGTRQSDKRILAVLDEKQEVPKNPHSTTRRNDDYTYGQEQGFDEAIDDMIAQGWKKTVEVK